MAKIQVEYSWETCLECIELGILHFNEVESKKDKIPYNVDKAMAKALFEADLLHIVTARDEGKLVGYFLSLVSPDLLTSELSAKEIGIFLHPDYRGSTLFIRMVKHTEKTLASLGIRQMLIMFKEGHNDQLPEKIGFEKTETVYQKILEI